MGYFAYHAFCCLNEREPGHVRGSCGQRGAEELHSYFKKRIKELGLSGPAQVRVNKSGCLDRCELGPVIVIYPDDVWYRVQTTDDVERIIQLHIGKGKPVEELRLGDRQKRL